MHKLTPGKFHQVKLISLTGEPIRIADVQAALSANYPARFMIDLCTAKDYVLQWSVLEPFYSGKTLMCIARDINRQFRQGKTAIRLVIDGIR